MKKFLITLLLPFLALSLSATDGYFTLGYGAVHKGMAGAGIGLHYTSLINGNPAGNVLIGKQWNVGVSFFSPFRKFTVTGNPSGIPQTFGLQPGTVESDSRLFVIPRVAANFMINDKSSFAFSLFGHGGMNTNYPTAVFYDQSESTTGVNLSQLLLGLTYSYALSENHNIGVTAMFAFQMFEAKGLATFAPFSTDPTKLSNNGVSTSTGYGLKVGYQGRLSDQFGVGAVYQSKMFMNEFEEYAGLYAQRGDFNIPSTWTVGLVYSPSSKVDIAFDFKKINFDDAAGVSNRMFSEDGTFQPLGLDDGAGFGWKNMSVFKLGIQLEASEDMSWRAGFSYGEQPIESSEVMFNILAPGVVESHLALGFSRRVGASDNQLHFAVNYAFNGSVSGVNPLDPPSGQEIKLEMYQFDFEVGFTF